MATFKNLNELAKYIDKLATEVLKVDVAEKVKDVMQDKVQTEVYDSYTSGSKSDYKYVRREEHGGLKDRRNMKSEVNGNILSVENVATGRDDSNLYLAGLVEYGHDNGYGEYDYPTIPYGSTGSFLEPREFIKETKKHLSESNDLQKSMAGGLKRQGLNIK